MRTHKQIAAGQRRTLKTMKKRIVEMAEEWDGIDQCCINFLEELAEKVQWTSDNLVDEDAA